MDMFAYALAKKGAGGGSGGGSSDNTTYAERFIHSFDNETDKIFSFKHYISELGPTSTDVTFSFNYKIGTVSNDNKITYLTNPHFNCELVIDDSDSISGVKLNEYIVGTELVGVPNTEEYMKNFITEELGYTLKYQDDPDYYHWISKISAGTNSIDLIVSYVYSCHVEKSKADAEVEISELAASFANVDNIQFLKIPIKEIIVQKV